MTQRNINGVNSLTLMNVPLYYQCAGLGR